MCKRDKPNQRADTAKGPCVINFKLIIGFQIHQKLPCPKTLTRSGTVRQTDAQTRKHNAPLLS